MKPKLLKILKRAKQELSGEAWALVQAQLDVIACVEKREKKAINAYVEAKLAQQHKQWHEHDNLKQSLRALARAQATVSLEYSWLMKGLKRLGCT